MNTYSSIHLYRFIKLGDLLWSPDYTNITFDGTRFPRGAEEKQGHRAKTPFDWPGTQTPKLPRHNKGRTTSQASWTERRLRAARVSGQQGIAPEPRG